MKAKAKRKRKRPGAGRERKEGMMTANEGEEKWKGKLEGDRRGGEGDASYASPRGLLK